MCHLAFLTACVILELEFRKKGFILAKLRSCACIHACVCSGGCNLIKFCTQPTASGNVYFLDNKCWNSSVAHLFTYPFIKKLWLCYPLDVCISVIAGMYEMLALVRGSHPSHFPSPSSPASKHEAAHLNAIRTVCPELGILHLCCASAFVWRKQKERGLLWTRV